jgi:Flp pilus assembly protein TadG
MRNRRSARGQNLVEVALVLPILIIMMLGIVSFGLIYFIRGSVENGAREGARYGSVNLTPTATADSIKDRVRRTVTAVDPSSLTIDVTCCDDTDVCNPPPDASCIPPNRVTVKVQYPLTTFWPGPAPATYGTSSTMRIENHDTVS